MDELVQRLAQGKHGVTIGGSQLSLDDFRKRVEEIGYVFIKFISTRGGTNLGVRVDSSATSFHQTDFGQCTNIAHVEGTLTLNYVKVRCIVDIEVETLNGTGYLVVLEEV